MLPYVLSNYKPVFQDSTNILLCSDCLPWVLCWRVKCVGSGTTPSNTFLLNDYRQPFKWMSAWEKNLKNTPAYCPPSISLNGHKKISFIILQFEMSTWTFIIETDLITWFLPTYGFHFCWKGGPFKTPKNAGLHKFFSISFAVP